MTTALTTAAAFGAGFAPAIDAVDIIGQGGVAIPEIELFKTKPFGLDLVIAMA